MSIEEQPEMNKTSAASPPLTEQANQGSAAPNFDETNFVEINIPARVDLVAVVRMIVAAATNAVEALQGDRLDDLRWVTSEATTNAIEANNSEDSSGRVIIKCAVADGRVRLSVKDDGPGLPERHEVPDITHPDRLFIEGGFGIPLMERLSSAVNYVSVESGTIVEMDLHQESN